MVPLHSNGEVTKTDHYQNPQLVKRREQLTVERPSEPKHLQHNLLLRLRKQSGRRSRKIGRTRGARLQLQDCVLWKGSWDLFHLPEGFVCVSCGCLMLKEVRKGYRIPWSHRWLWASISAKTWTWVFWKQPAILTPEPLSRPSLLAFYCSSFIRPRP